MQPLRMRIVWDVLEMAKDAKDEHVISACRRLIRANTLGWTKHRDTKDWSMVKSFAEMDVEVIRNHV